MFSRSLLFSTLVIALGLFGLMQRPAAEGLGLSDPTRPSGWRPGPRSAPVDEAHAVAGLQLQGVFSAAGRRSAMISGRRVAVGDRVSGAEVVEIGNHRVVLRIGGETVELASLRPHVKSPSRTQGAAQ